MHKLQIHKLVSRHDHLNISTMYSVFDWNEFEILSYRWAFLESTKISASEELNALEKAPVQFMALQILRREGRSSVYAVLERTKCFGKGTSTLYAIAEIKWPVLDSTKISAFEEPNAFGKGASSVYAIAEIKQEMPFSPFGFARVTEVRHIRVGEFVKFDAKLLAH